MSQLLIGGLAGLLLVPYLSAPLTLLGYPHAIAEGDGLVAYHYQQFRASLDFSQLYPDFASPPYIVNPYAPLYTLINAAVDVYTQHWHPFLAGRLVNITSLGVILFCLYQAVRRFSGNRWLAMLSLLWLLSDPAYLSYVIQVRPDLSAVALAVTGLCLYLFSQKTRYRLLAGLALAGALLTKQSHLALPLSLLVWEGLSRRDWKRAVPTWLSFALVGVVSLGWLQWQTSGHFWTQVISLNAAQSQHFFATQYFSLRFFVFNGLLIVIAATLTLRMVKQLYDKPKIAPNQLLSWTLLYALLSTVLFVATVGKTGSAMNYWIEPAFAMTLLGFGFSAKFWHHCWQLGRHRPLILLPMLGLLSALIWPRVVVFSQIADGILRYLPVLPVSVAHHDLVLERLRASGQPYLADSPYFAPYTPTTVALLDALIYTQLSKAEVWDDAPFLQSIETKSYGLLVMEYGCQNDPVETAHNIHMHPTYCAAIEANYERSETIGPYHIYRAR